ncbi:MAG: nitrogenase iron-molybdenum cofactor biosynthesis protein NifN [Magnetovibrionaceae bacterium]
MSEIVKRKKALSVSPLKSSSTIGAALAFLGFQRAIPMLHGSQGCTAFGKVFFVRHFREPVPLQTTAMDQISTVLGGDESVVEGLTTIAEKNRPAIIGLPTTGLVETEGADIALPVRAFRDKHPEFDDVMVVAVNTPDFTGCLETGFADALTNIFKASLPIKGTNEVAERPKQVNVLVSSSLSPGDIDEIKDLVEAFGLRPVVVPDLGDSLDGHLPENDFNPLTTGGTPVSEVRDLAKAAATLVIGGSLDEAANVLYDRTGVPEHRFSHLMTMEAVDSFVMALSEISGEPVPAKLERQRSRLQDALLDCHFSMGFSRIGVAADPDMLVGFGDLLKSMGSETVAAVSPVNAKSLRECTSIDTVKIGDLEDLEKLATEGRAQLLIGNSHVVDSAERLGVPILRAGFPQYDYVGGFARAWVGYRAIRQALFDIANLLASTEPGEVAPYVSIFNTSDRSPDNGPSPENRRQVH